MKRKKIKRIHVLAITSHTFDDDDDDDDDVQLMVVVVMVRLTQIKS